MKERVERRSNFFPRNGFDLTRVELPDAPFDFLGPGGFYVFIRLAMKGFQNPACQLRPVRFGEARGLAKKLIDCSCHYDARSFLNAEHFVRQ
jgi:hypothetical protein